ncbi:acyl-CoA thioesterase [Alkalihalobacterium bogoriense]|uniref:acyl-CoA thioesterase n=1 Tax=Alkalihalobacterium bogoriense TaxID=246272 RepID=UPI00047BF237|nr:acyl-CoA thioesterase [Alkalihalobacterium bogoriense]
MNAKYTKQSRVVKTHLVLPNDTNNHASLFGGILMRNMDEVASISARRHCRTEVVTASTDSVDFLHPILQTDSVCLEAFVSWTGTTSMEVFVKVIAEDLNTEERKIAATAFLTFVAMDKKGKPVQVPGIIPETEEEKKLFETGAERATVRKERRKKSRELAEFMTTRKPWE